MGVAAAFPSVARGCLLRKMRNAKIDECLVRWTDSFMRGRRVIMSLDSQDGEEMPVSTNLPQGSPASPALLAIYIAEIHQTVESRVEDSRGISSVDDVTWLVEGVDVYDVVSKLEHAPAPAWSGPSTTRFAPRLQRRAQRPSSFSASESTGDARGLYEPEAWQCIFLQRPPAG